MTIETSWQNQATNILKGELARKGIGYEDLSQALKKIGVDKTANNINVTINRGTFSFVFFLQCAQALSIDKIQL